MKVLLTGAQGFLGGRVLDFLLEKDYQVRAIVRRPAPELAARGVELVQADLCDAAKVEEAAQGRDGIIHCAARSGIWGPLAEYLKANLVSTLNILAAARRAGVGWLVHTSSPSVIHTGAPLDGVDESAPYTQDARQGYPYSKMLAERAVLSADGPDFRTVALRPHLIWGPGDPHFLPRMLERAKAGSLWLLETKALVDGVFIDNAARAHLLAAEKLQAGEGRLIGGRAIFVAQGEPLTAAALIQKILTAVSEPGHPLRIKGLIPARLGRRAGWLMEALWKILPLSGEPPLTRFVVEELTLPHWFKLDRLKNDLGFTEPVSTEEGLRIMRDWAESRDYLLL